MADLGGVRLRVCPYGILRWRCTTNPTCNGHCRADNQAYSHTRVHNRPDRADDSHHHSHAVRYSNQRPTNPYRDTTSIANRYDAN